MLINKLNILILTPEKEAYSTTFIKAHFEHLKGNKFHLYGIFFPIFSSENLLLDKNSFKTIFNKAVGKFVKKDFKFSMKEDLAAYIKEKNIHVVLAEFGPVGAEVIPVCKKLEIPLIVHFHGFDAYVDHILKEYYLQYQEMFKYAKAIVVVSRHMERQLVSLGASPQKVIYNCYGPSVDFFDNVPDFNSLNFIAVGRFVDKKAPYLTLSAFKQFLEKFPEAKLTMVGDGPLLFTCKNLSESWGISDKVHFVGAVSHNETRKIYQSAYCFLQHSITADNGDSEGTPVGILEAQAAGIPVIATKHAGIVDVILPNETGYMVDEGDVNAMANFMEKLAIDKVLAKEIGMKGRKRIQDEFTLSRHIKVLNEIIEKAANENVN